MSLLWTVTFAFDFVSCFMSTFVLLPYPLHQPSTEHGCVSSCHCNVRSCDLTRMKGATQSRTSSSMFGFACFPKPFWPIYFCDIYLWKGLFLNCTSRSNKALSRTAFAQAFSRKSSVLSGREWRLREARRCFCLCISRRMLVVSLIILFASGEKDWDLNTKLTLQPVFPLIWKAFRPFKLQLFQSTFIPNRRAKPHPQSRSADEAGRKSS